VSGGVPAFNAAALERVIEEMVADDQLELHPADDGKPILYRRLRVTPAGKDWLEARNLQHLFPEGEPVHVWRSLNIIRVGTLYL
jgi:hypothetical protein